MKPYQYLPLLKQLWLIPVSFAFLLLFIVSKNENLNDLLFMANYDGGLDGLSLEFNKDGTFNMYAGDLTCSEKLRGTFQFQDSTIVLNRSFFLPTIPTSRFVIRSSRSGLNKGGSRSYLYPIDKEGRVISGAPSFCISSEIYP